MFARSVSFRLKPDSIAAFTKLIEDKTLPLLRKQKGFQDEITLVVPGGRDAVGIWLRELRRFTLTRLPIRPSTRSPLAVRLEGVLVLGGGQVRPFRLLVRLSS